jgi:hypothetical protein
MRSDAGRDDRRGRGVGLGLAMACLCLWGGPEAQAQARETVWLTTSAVGHDALANCLAKAMSGEFVAAPVVFAPPKRSAYVNLWPRVRQPVDPVATFHVDQEKEGVSRIGWQRLVDSPAGARWDATAKAAANRCATAGR